MIRALLILGLAAICQAQPREFEVAAIKPGEPGAFSSIQFNPDGSVVSRGTTVRALIETAYDVLSFQVSGGPKWIESERFALQAAGVACRAISPGRSSGGSGSGGAGTAAER